MPRMRVDASGLAGFRKGLTALSTTALDGCLKLSLYEGAKVIADQVRQNLQALPEDKFRFLRGKDMYNVVTREEKEDLLDALDVTAHKRVGESWTVKITFAGYGKRQHPTKAYPNGIPNPMIAASVESGSSVRRKHPFIRPALAQAKAAAEAAMSARFDEAVNKTMKAK